MKGKDEREVRDNFILEVGERASLCWNVPKLLFLREEYHENEDAGMVKSRGF
jgi:hypothetical protein